MAREVWPSWRYGPGKAKAVFECAADVPDGWVANRAHVFAEPVAEPVVDAEEPAAEVAPAPVKRGPGRPKKG